MELSERVVQLEISNLIHQVSIQWDFDASILTIGKFLLRARLSFSSNAVCRVGKVRKGPTALPRISIQSRGHVLLHKYNIIYSDDQQGSCQLPTSKLAKHVQYGKRLSPRSRHRYFLLSEEIRSGRHY